MAEEHSADDSKFHHDSDASLAAADSSAIDAKDTPGEDTSAGKQQHCSPISFHHRSFHLHLLRIVVNFCYFCGTDHS
jgi:hypothetical protein